jgi:TIR domain
MNQAVVARTRSPSGKTTRPRSGAAGRTDSAGPEAQKGPPAPDRRILFISHANPEDNPAAAWFATQLTLLGYYVWCDLKSTHGGESDFWLKVQKTIENDAVKFVYLLSDTSCDFERKKGIYKELQTADNLRRDNFIIPVVVEKLTRSRPILLSTSIYIDGENWAIGLRELVDRLNEDGVTKRADIDFEKISAWWPAASVEKIIRSDAEDDLVTNILGIKALPENIHFLKVFSERNPLTGFERLRSVLPSRPTFYAHGDHAITFANQFDLAQLTTGLEFETAFVANTRDFLAFGHKEGGVPPDIARNIATYLVGQAWDGFMESKNLSTKATRRSRRSIWYPRDGQLLNNKAGVAEAGKRKVSIQLVGTVKHFRKNYRWHFGVYSTVDLRVHEGIILSPKAVISLPHKRSANELGAALDDTQPAPFLVDDKKVLKALNWWNKAWRQKLLALVSWLCEGRPEIVIPVGYQQIIVSSEPQNHTASKSFIEISDDAVINRAMEGIIERAPSP